MFIVFEGMDGAGKSTQVQLLCEWLGQQGLRVETCVDPGTTPLGESLREILLRRDDIDIAARSEMLMFMTARAQMVAQRIRPALERGEIVVSDRFAMSTVVYQGFAGSLNVEDIWQVARIATDNLQPDLTLVLDLPVGEFRGRLAGAADRMESRSDEYFAKVCQGYRELAARMNDVELIDATQPIPKIHQKIVAAVRRHPNWKLLAENAHE